VAIENVGHLGANSNERREEKHRKGIDLMLIHLLNNGRKGLTRESEGEGGL